MGVAPLSLHAQPDSAPEALIAQFSPAPPLRIAIAGLVHDHVHGILQRQKKGTIEIAGIAESNKDLAVRYSKQYGFSMDLVFDTVEEMLAKTKPEAVADFNSIFDHLKTVQICAPKGVHVMVEKPLAVSVAHAKEMRDLALKNNIQLLTNYETTWYGTHHRARQYVLEDKKIGDLRKVVFHTGHEGPKEIGVTKEFFDWLTDPVANGAGALTDFGCYGSNLATWFMKGKKPATVSCITQQVKPDIYPKVDDECTIILTYPKTQVIIQASWNWPFGVKNTQLYGKTGYIICEDKNNITYRYEKQEKAAKEVVPENNAPYNDSLSYLTAVLRKEITPQPFDLSALDNNMIVCEILDAAKESAKKGTVVHL